MDKNKHIGKEKSVKDKRKRRSGHQHQHHPWDEEVSLPGAGTSDQKANNPTILEVLNNPNILAANVKSSLNEIRNTTSEQEPQSSTEEQTDVEQSEQTLTISTPIETTSTILTPQCSNENPETFTVASSVNDLPEKVLVNEINTVKTANIEVQPQQQQQQQSQEGESNQIETESVHFEVTPQTPQPDHSNPSNTLVDIESHLIETYNEYQEEKDAVGIKELPPIQHELTTGSSKIETDTVVRTVIEVEPIGVKTKKLVETVVHLDEEQQAKLADTQASEVNGNSSNNNSSPTIDEDIKRIAEDLVCNIEAAAVEKVALQQTLQNPSVEIVIDQPKDIEDTETATEIEIEAEVDGQPLSTLSQRVDEQLAEVTSILKKTSNNNNNNLTPHCDQIKLVDVPKSKTPSEAEVRKEFIDSLPQISTSDTDTKAQQLASDCKREYYQSLKKYLLQSTTDKPPVPLQTYRWEDLKRAKERGGYPWTHLYKRPLGPDEEPEILLLLRKSQELRFASESPKSLKKVRIDDQVLIKETERYIQELSEDEDEDEDNDHYHNNDDEEEEVLSDQEHHLLDRDHTHLSDDAENHSLHSESISCVSDSVLATSKPRKPYLRLANIRSIIKRRRSARSNEDSQSLPGTLDRKASKQKIPKIQIEKTESTGEFQSTPVNGEASPQKTPRCFPIMKKLKSMADRQKKRLQIKRVPLKKDERIVLNDETKILKLKKSPKSERGEIPHFIEKQDSDDILEIVELDESPSRKKRDDGRSMDEEEATTSAAAAASSIVQPDEIIEITNLPKETGETVEKIEATETTEALPPRKTPRLRREHVYEEISEVEATDGDENMPTSDVFEIANSIAAMKESLNKQDTSAFEELENITKPQIPLDRMGSSEEEQIAGAGVGGKSTLAPLSSIDSASSDEDRNRPQLSPVSEESDIASVGENEIPRVVEDAEHPDLKSSIKKEASPAPSDKKFVTFSHVEDEAEPHREDIELPEHILEATAAHKKANNASEHEYEPIGVPPTEIGQRDPFSGQQPTPADEIEVLRDEMKEAEELQKDLEERYFSSEATTPRTESRTDYEIHTSQVDSSALEELPLKPENRKKSFMASAQDRTRRMQAGFKNQAGKLKTKLRSSTASSPKKAPSGSPKAKERRRFKAPELSKLKMPEIKRPDMSKLKELKRPEFTKFHKPDMSKFKLPEKFSTLKLQRSKSLKENEPPREDTEFSGTTGEEATQSAEPPKKLFEFNFGTYPRAFRKKKKPAEPVELSFGTETPTTTEGPSIIPSTDTQPSFESSSSPQGDRGPGPVRSRWADKFSDVSYNDSEGSRYRRYGSEQESFDRESSLERRMKEDLEDTGSEAQELGILSGTGDNKQFAEFDEENRAIHEISNLRAGEFKRRPMVHQDSDLRSEDSRDAVGWTDKEIQKIKLLRKAELEAEASYLKFPSEEGIQHETQSTASSGKKVVMEEIDDDEFFLRKRGVSEDNIELRQYISNAIREGYDIPVNALEHVGQARQPIEYGEYDVPPPKPRRLHKTYRPQDVSQEFGSQRSDYGDDLSMSQNGSDFFTAPRRPMRKGRSRSKYSMESQDVPAGIMALDDEESDMRHERYFDDDEEYLRPPKHTTNGFTEEPMNNLNFTEKNIATEVDSAHNFEDVPQPQAPRRRKRHLRDTSMEKDSFINSLSGRSVSNNYLQPTEDVIVYRTEHEYYKPPILTSENDTDDSLMPTQKSRFADDHDDDDDHIANIDQKHETLDTDLRYRLKYDEEVELRAEPENLSLADSNIQEKFVIDMLENDGYAVVRKEQIPKPTPPARRKKFSRSAGERFSTMPPHTISIPDSPQPPERPPPPRGYIPFAEQQQRPQSAQSSEPYQKDDDDYEEPEFLDNERPESPRDLQSGEVINKMKYRPLPPPPRPPREKRQRSESKRSAQDQDSESDFGRSSADHKRLAGLSSDESYVPTDEFEDEIHFQEVEVSTQTDPLPDDFVCEEFEITDDMRVIEPRLRQSPKTLDDLLKDEQQRSSMENTLLTEDEQLARGLQRFRDANQRSMSERSRASSQADRSKSLSRPQTPSAIIIERRVSTPVPSHHENETMLQASLIVRPIDDLDLEEEALRREGLLTDSSQHSRSDVTDHNIRDPFEEQETRKILSDYSHTPSSVELETAVENLRSHEDLEILSEREVETGGEDEIDDSARRERTMRDYGYSEEEILSSEHEDEKAASTAEEEVEGRTKTHWLEDEARHVSSLDDVDKRLDQTIEDIIEKHIRGSYTEDEDVVDHVAIDSTLEEEEIENEDEEVPPPQPPPRRKSTVGADQSPGQTIPEEKIITTKDVTPVQTTEEVKATEVPLPYHLGDLEVERLRVRALQAGQIMVSQLHGGQISAEELECKSGNLVVKGVELPPGFIEDIVDRVRSTERGPLLTTETQTSPQASNEILAIEQAAAATSSGSQQMVPPPKPPRHRDIDAIERLKNQDEETQTDASAQPTQPPPPPVFATTEYLEALVPLLRKDLESRQEDQTQSDGGKSTDPTQSRQHHCHHHHRRHHHYHRCSSSESDFNDDTNVNDFDADGNYRAPSSLERRQHSRSRSRTRPPSECPSQSVSQAGRQFISACSLSLVSIIDQLTGCIRGEANKDQDVETHNTRLRQVPTLVILFIIITFGVLIFLLTGRNVHTHHWDFFNPPGNEGRQS